MLHRSCTGMQSLVMATNGNKTVLLPNHHYKISLRNAYNETLFVLDYIKYGSGLRMTCENKENNGINVVRETVGNTFKNKVLRKLFGYSFGKCEETFHMIDNHSNIIATLNIDNLKMCCETSSKSSYNWECQVFEDMHTTDVYDNEMSFLWGAAPSPRL